MAEVHAVKDKETISLISHLLTIRFSKQMLLIGTAMDPFHWRRNGPTPFVP